MYIHENRNMSTNMSVTNSVEPTRWPDDEILAIIPARGGSKGVPRKNIQPVGGKPLIAYSIETALAARNIDRVVVSTDDDEIAEIAMGYGAEVPFLRPAELACDISEIMHTLKDCRNRLFDTEGYMPSIQVVMYPTHPFRKLSTIEKLVDLLRKQYGHVYTAKEVIIGSIGLFSRDNGTIHQLRDSGRSTAGRRYLRSYGYFYGMNLDFTPGRYVHVLRDELELIDIDDWKDITLADGVIKHQLFDFTL